MKNYCIKEGGQKYAKQYTKSSMNQEFSGLQAL